MLGAMIEGVQFSGCVYDTVEDRWVSNVCLGVLENSFNFDPMYASALRFEKFVINHLITGAPQEVVLHNKLPITTIRIRLK